MENLSDQEVIEVIESHLICVHWRRFVKNIGMETKIFGERVVITDEFHRRFSIIGRAWPENRSGHSLWTDSWYS